MTSAPKPLLPRRAFVLGALGLAGCIPLEAAPSPPRSGPAGATSLRRGINAGNALDAPTEGAWGVVLDEPFFDAVAAAGFDHVRVPIRFNAHASKAPPFTIDEDFFRRVDWALDQIARRGMAAVIDLHHHEELMKDPDAEGARFLELWRQIAVRYRGRPASVIYELLNEPTDKLTADRWNTLLAQALKVVRPVDPDRRIIVDSAFWAAAKELKGSLELPPGDTRLIGSFHMYQPILFTHQGMPWMPPEFQTEGITFPGPPQRPVEPIKAAADVGWVADWFRQYNTVPAANNPGGPAAIEEQFEYARAFMARTGLPVYMGEFGAADKGDHASRVTWTRMVRKAAEARGIGWAYWDDGGSFKIYDRKAATWDRALLAALFD